MVFGAIASAITSLAAFAFPTFASYKAIKANDNSQLTPWLMFWSVQACVLFVEHWCFFLLQWIPLYKETKMVFTLWMVLPQTQGATYLYLHYLHPTISDYEHDLDHVIVRLHEQVRSKGGRYVEILIRWVYQILSGTSYEHDASSFVEGKELKGVPEQDRAPVTSEGYVASLLSRFRTVPVGAFPETIPSSLFSFLNSTGKGDGDIIPPSLSPEERVKYVAQQKAKLQEWLHMLDAAAQSYPPVNLSSGTNASAAQRRQGGRLSTSAHRSSSGVVTPNNDSDYEDLGQDEAVRGGKAPPKPSGGWFWKTRTD